MVHHADGQAEPPAAEDQWHILTEESFQAPPNPTAPTHETAGVAADIVQTPPQLPTQAQETADVAGANTQPPPQHPAQTEGTAVVTAANVQPPPQSLVPAQEATDTANVEDTNDTSHR